MVCKKIEMLLTSPFKDSKIKPLIIEVKDYSNQDKRGHLFDAALYYNITANVYFCQRKIKRTEQHRTPH